MFQLDERLKEDTLEIGSSQHNLYLLMNDSSYPWVIMVPKVDLVTEIFHLDEEYSTALHNESKILSEYLSKSFRAHKMNVANLGNIVSQLHIHHIVRTKEDKSWPGPVWGKHPAAPYRLSGDGVPALVKTISFALSELIEGFEPADPDSD